MALYGAFEAIINTFWKPKQRRPVLWTGERRSLIQALLLRALLRDREKTNCPACDPPVKDQQTKQGITGHFHPHKGALFLDRG